MSHKELIWLNKYHKYSLHIVFTEMYTPTIVVVDVSLFLVGCWTVEGYSDKE